MNRKEAKLASKIARQEQFTSIMTKMTRKDLVKNFILSVSLNIVTSAVIIIIFILLIRNTTNASTIATDDFYKSVSFGMCAIFIISLSFHLFRNRADRVGKPGAKYLYWVQVATHSVVIVGFAISYIIFAA